MQHPRGPFLVMRYGPKWGRLGPRFIAVAKRAYTLDEAIAWLTRGGVGRVNRSWWISRVGVPAHHPIGVKGKTGKGTPMDLAEILRVLEAATKLIEALKGLGIDMSGVKLQTSTPIDVLGLLNKRDA